MQLQISIIVLCIFLITSNIFTNTTSSEESAILDVKALMQPSITQQEMQLPAPAVKLSPHKNAFLAVGMSSLVPGLGHVYLGDLKTAGSLMGTMGAALGTASLSYSNEFIFSTSLLTVQTSWLYSIYATYRDVRAYNGYSGYSYQMPKDSFADLVAAPFRLSILKKPEVWGCLLGSFAIAFTAAYFAFPEDAHIHSARSLKNILSPLTALPVGIGEESFFRGFLQSQLSEVFTPWGGIVLSSVLFGLAHIPNAQDLDPQDRRGYYTVIVPLLAASGIYDGWLTYKNHSLASSVAIHTWYDFVLFAIGSLMGESTITGRSNFAITIPF